MRARLIRWAAIALLPMIFKAVQRRMSNRGRDENTFEHREDENTF